MTLSLDDAFGITEERKKQWCLLGVSLEGHPTYCMSCHKLKITVVTRGAAPPAQCDCGAALTLPPVRDHYARQLMTQAGHQNLFASSTDR